MGVFETPENLVYIEQSWWPVITSYTNGGLTVLYCARLGCVLENLKYTNIITSLNSKNSAPLNFYLKLYCISKKII